MDKENAKYEFNAPQFLDFTSSVIHDDGADSYFDTDHEKDRRLTQIVEPVSSSQSANSSGNNLQPSSSMSNDGVSSSTSDCLDSTQTALDMTSFVNLQNALDVQPPPSARKIKPAYAPEIKMTKVNGTMVQDIVMVEVPYQGMRIKQHKRTTKVEPFSFEERDRMMQKQKEEKIKKILEEEKKLREFHAKPVPDFSHTGSQFMHTQSITQPVEIEFHTDKRLEERHKRAKHCDSEKEEKFQFKAKPAVVLQKPPFEPKKGDHSALTDVTGFHLNTEERARKREEFDLKIKQKEATHNMIRAQRQQEEEQQILEEVQRMRKNAVHKANPIPRKIIENPFKVMPSSAPLTEPKTPTVLSRKRTHE